MQRLRRSFGPREPADRGRRVETGLDGRFHFARAPIGLPEGRKGEGTMTAVRKWGFAYAALFVAVVAVGYVPGFEDAEGNLFGLFKLDLYDDALHLASGLWAGIAAALSDRAARGYFR